jgi:hypothetical protein
MKRLLVILFLFSLSITGQEEVVKTTTAGYYEVYKNGVLFSQHQREDKATAKAANLLFENENDLIEILKPKLKVEVDRSSFNTRSYVKDSIYNIYVAKDLSLIFTTTPDQYTIIFEDGQSFTAQATGQLLLGMWANHNLRLYIDQINGKDYIIKIEIP